jgi:hypothetical protein
MSNIIGVDILEEIFSSSSIELKDLLVCNNDYLIHALDCYFEHHPSIISVLDREIRLLYRLMKISRFYLEIIPYTLQEYIRECPDEQDFIYCDCSEGGNYIHEVIYLTMEEYLQSDRLVIDILDPFDGSVDWVNSEGDSVPSDGYTIKDARVHARNVCVGFDCNLEEKDIHLGIPRDFDKGYLYALRVKTLFERIKNKIYVA